MNKIIILLILLLSISCSTTKRYTTLPEICISDIKQTIENETCYIDITVSLSEICKENLTFNIISDNENLITEPIKAIILAGKQKGVAKLKTTYSGSATISIISYDGNVYINKDKNRFDLKIEIEPNTNKKNKYCIIRNRCGIFENIISIKHGNWEYENNSNNSYIFINNKNMNLSSTDKFIVNTSLINSSIPEKRSIIIYCDWNNNNKFDRTEILYINSNLIFTEINKKISFDVKIPNNAYPSSMMRIILFSEMEHINNNIESEGCGEINSGVVFDIMYKLKTE